MSIGSASHIELGNRLREATSHRDFIRSRRAFARSADSGFAPMSRVILGIGGEQEDLTAWEELSRKITKSIGERLLVVSNDASGRGLEWARMGVISDVATPTLVTIHDTPDKGALAYAHLEVPVLHGHEHRSYASGDRSGVSEMAGETIAVATIQLNEPGNTALEPLKDVRRAQGIEVFVGDSEVNMGTAYRYIGLQQAVDACIESDAQQAAAHPLSA